MPTRKKMVIQKTWKQFRNIGLLVMISQILHIFGWTIVLELNNNGSIKEAYPVRCKS